MDEKINHIFLPYWYFTIFCNLFFFQNKFVYQSHIQVIQIFLFYSCLYFWCKSLLPFLFLLGFFLVLDSSLSIFKSYLGLGSKPLFNLLSLKINFFYPLICLQYFYFIEFLTNHFCSYLSLSFLSEFLYFYTILMITSDLLYFKSFLIFLISFFFMIL